MTYSTAQKNEAARLLCTYFLHLHFGVARRWVTCESGANNDVFGVTIGGKLQKYATMEAGVKAAAIRIRTLVIYRAVLAAFESPHDPAYGCPGNGEHAISQARALCKSGWHSGVAGVKAQGGLDLYYSRIFRLGGYAV